MGKGEKIMKVLAIPKENKVVINEKQFKTFMAKSSSGIKKKAALKRASRISSQIKRRDK